ncbi:MAG: glycoside hydrolase family 2 TIM barrel-domain containing protein [Halanaerobiaceae bacterium]
MISDKLPQENLRKEKCLNGKWKFKCEVDDNWTEIKVPSCYSIQRDGGKWDRFYWDTFGYPKRWSKKGAVYEKKFRIPQDMKDMNLRFVCEGAFYHSETYLNGKKIGEFHDGYFPFAHFLPDSVKLDGDNKLTLKIKSKPGKTNGGESVDNRGIWQDTYLQAYSDIFVENNIWVQTSFENNKIKCELPVRNCTNRKRKVFIRNFITDHNDNIVKLFDGGWKTIPGTKVINISCGTDWHDPHLWFPHDPYLYHLHTVIYDENENPVDKNKIRFGFREITWQGPHLYINNRELYLRGHGGHYCGDLQGTKEYAKKWLQSLKEYGVNFMRLHVYPKHNVLYEAADEVGFLLEAEAAFHFKVTKDKEYAKKHVERLIKDERNHPSVIMYSVSNELRWRGGGEKKYLIDHAQSIDHTRPIFASDFSGWSVHGDLLGHHYNGDSVFSEWEEFGPDKPMIWDEVGNVWQPDRPLDNGTSGYEVRSQDYATGLWRDGHDEMLKNLKNIEDGEIINGELHRVNAKIPWDFGYNFFRFQPINNHKTLELNENNLNKPGIKQNFIKSCASTINIWDENLPVFEPNPGFYLFSKYMRPVRFHKEEEGINFYEQKIVNRTSKLIYEDTRFADTLLCKIESINNNEILSKNKISVEIEPGDIKDKFKSTWQIPEVNEVTPVKYVREFKYQNQTGFRDEIEGKIFPEFNPGTIKGLNQQTIGIYDPRGKTANLLNKLNLGCKQISDISEVNNVDYDILIIGEENDSKGLSQDFVKNGGKVICLCQKTKPDLPVNVPSLKSNFKGNSMDIYCLLNGTSHYILDQLAQKDFHYWQGEAIDKAYMLPVKNNNFRTILAGDKDGVTASLFEIMEGKGTYIFCQLNIIDSFDKEPVAAYLFKNMLQYTLNYQPAEEPGLTGLITNNDDLVNYFKDLGLIFDNLTSGSLVEQNIEKYEVLIIDGKSESIINKIAFSYSREINKFLENQGKIMVLNINEKTLPQINKLVSKDLYLSEPYLGEQKNCIKAAISWTKRNTPAELIKYYDNTLIPQPFEPNKDRLLSGISNFDLNWEEEKIFEKGIKFTGINPVYAFSDYRIIISNWKIDWSRPVYGGEYIHEAKDIRRANWFLNRDPVVLKIRERNGYFLYNQMNILKGGDKGKRVTCQLLTGMKASIGNNTFFRQNLEYEKKQAKEVLKRQQELEVPKTVEIQSYANTGIKKTSDLRLPQVLFLGDKLAESYISYIEDYLKEKAEIYYRTLEKGTTELVLKRLDSWLEINNWDVIYLNFGLQDIISFDDEEQKVSLSEIENNISPDEFRHNLLNIIAGLKRTDAKIFWNSILPVPEDYSERIKKYFRKYNSIAEQIMEQNNVYINDLSSVLKNSDKNIRKGKSILFNERGKKLIGKQIGEAIQFFGE